MVKETKWYWRFLAYFRHAQLTYISFIVSMGTFMIVAYKLLIQEIPFLEQLLPSFTTFIIIFLTVYVPIVVVIGWINIKRGSYPSEAIVVFDNNPRSREMYNNIKEIKQILSDENKRREN